MQEDIMALVQDVTHLQCEASAHRTQGYCTRMHYCTMWPNQLSCTETHCCEFSKAHLYNRPDSPAAVAHWHAISITY